MTVRRIDTHCHVIPPGYARWLADSPLFHDRLPKWNLEDTLDLFERANIDTGILSVTIPGTWLGPKANPDDSRHWAREVNEFRAELVRDWPWRFGQFATLPLPDVDAAIAEARYSVRELHADGVTLLANVGGRYLGTPEWDVLFEELDALGCVVFVHPNVLPATPLPGIMPGTVDFLADTTRAAVNLIAHDYLSRYPSVTFILSHGGGYLPYAALRVAASLPGQDGEGEQQRIDRILGQLGQFWFDTALTGGPALPTLLAFAGPDRITFGSDHPFAGRDKSLYFTAALDNALASNDIDSGLAHAVARGNAERLFPRLARRFHCDDVVVTQEVLQANEKHGSRDLTEPVA